MTEAEEKERLRYLQLKAKAAGGIPVSREPGDLATESTPAPKQAETTLDGALNTGVRGFIDSGSLGFGDEARAAIGSIPAVGKYLRTPFGELFDKGPRDEKTYKESLAEIRGEDDAAAKENPGIHTVAEVAGAFAAPGPGKAKGATMLARLGKTALTSGALAGLAGLGNSRASLLDGELAEAGKDAGLSALIAAPLSLIPGAIGEGSSKLLSKAKAGLLRAKGDAAAKVLSTAESGVRSAVSGKGGATSAARNGIEVLREIIARAEDLPADMVAAAKAKLASPEAQAMEKNVFSNALEGFGGKQGALTAAEEKLREALAQKTPEALAKAEEAFLANPLLRQFWPRAKKQIIDRGLVPAIGGIVGSTGGAILGNESPGASAGIGGAGGMVAGVLANGMMGGKASSAFERMMDHPAMRKMAWGALEKALQTGNKLLGRWEAPLAAAAAQGAEALRAADEELSRKDPSYSAMKTGLLLHALPNGKKPEVSPADYGSNP